jgi:hypothetical protein
VGDWSYNSAWHRKCCVCALGEETDSPGQRSPRDGQAGVQGEEKEGLEMKPEVRPMKVPGFHLGRGKCT